jgi:MORN repeat
MTKKTQTTAQVAPSTTSTNAQATTSTTLATPSLVAPLAPVSSASSSRRQLPSCQGPDSKSWNACEGTARINERAGGDMLGVYRGEFRDGQANGYGTYNTDGRDGGMFKYVGEVRDGVPKGLGTYTISNAAYSLRAFLP